MDTIEYWKRQWNFISDTKNVANNSKAIEEEQRRGIYYYDTKGKLVRREESEEYRNYIIMRLDGKEYGEVYYVTIPNNESIETIKFIGSKKSEYEMGIAIATDGSCSDIAYGSKDKISKEQWGKVLDKLRSEGKTIAYLIHSHPMDLTGAKIEVRDGRPSDVDYNTVFYEDNVGAIIYWKQVRSGSTRDKHTYSAFISFYREGDDILLELKEVFIDDFAKNFAKKW